MILKLSKWIGLSLFCLIVALLLSGTAYQFISAKRDKSAFPCPGTMVDIGGYRLHFQSMGSGGPTVILDSGLGGSGLSWFLVQPEIAKFAQVVSYDRAGMGWSDPSPLPRTSQQIVEELHTLLTNANIPKPYILIGHSFGGNNVQLYAATYPDEVLGIVLVDSAHEDHFRKLPPNPFESKWMQNSKVVYLMSKIGLTRLLSNLYSKQMPSFIPDSMKTLHIALFSTTKYQLAMAGESRLLAKSLQQMENADRSLIRNKPCFVLTAGQEADLSVYGMSEEHQKIAHAMHLAWCELQTDLVSKFANARQFIAERSDHMIPLLQPELIVQAAKVMIEEQMDQKEKSL